MARLTVPEELLVYIKKVAKLLTDSKRGADFEITLKTMKSDESLKPLFLSLLWLSGRHIKQGLDDCYKDVDLEESMKEEPNICLTLLRSTLGKLWRGASKIEDMLDITSESEFLAHCLLLESFYGPSLLPFFEVTKEANVFIRFTLMS